MKMLMKNTCALVGDWTADGATEEAGLENKLEDLDHCAPVEE